jgi:hypothetical protein
MNVGISGPSSYVSVCQQFLAHWEDLNTALGASPLVLAGNVIGWSTPIDRAAFEGMYTSLLTQRNTVTTAGVAESFARGDVHALKATLVSRAAEVIAVVRGNLSGTKYERTLPRQPDSDSTQHVLQEACMALHTIWVAVDADATVMLPKPIVLQAGLTAAAFLTLVATLAPAYRTLAEKEGQARLERETRNDQQDDLYEVMKAYREVAAKKFAADHALMVSIPALTPPPGATPDAVALSGGWNGGQTKAELFWDESTTDPVDEYEVFAVPGPEFDVEDEVSLGVVPKGQPRTFLTDALHQAPGQVATYKVYAKTPTGHRAGSNALTVSRPV